MLVQNLVQVHPKFFESLENKGFLDLYKELVL